MIIRHLQEVDFPPVAELLRRTYGKSARLGGLTPDRLRYELQQRGGDPRQDYLVLESQQGEVVGFCGYSTPGGNGQARMDGPVIAYGQRGQGLGERLWHELADLMRGRRVCQVSVMVAEENRLAGRFLERLGFKRGTTQLIVTSDRPYEGQTGRARGITIRRITDADEFDREAYLQLHGKLFEPRGRTFLDVLVALPDYNIFIAEQHGEMVGFLELELCEDVAIIESFGVHPDLRRKSYGSALLRTALDYAWRQKGIKLVRQIWKTDQPEFLKVYTSLGFRQKTALHQMVKAIG